MTASGPVGVGIIGAGNISTQYLDSLTAFPDLVVHTIADLAPQAAASRAAEYGISAAGSVEAALSHPDVEIIINLTTPAAHVAVATAAITAGKHVWSEKPFSLDRESGLRLLETADAAGLRLGSAPDTFLGNGLQSVQRAIERGDIGTPLSGLTMMQYAGPDAWHPNPAFLFQHGAGPLFDMGPYYLTALIQALGPVAKVAAVGSRSRPTRTIGSGDRAGESFTVDVPTHVSTILEFEQGGSSHSIFSFDSPLTRMGFVEITGTEGTLAAPDPNEFNGDLRILSSGSDEWKTIPTTASTAGRGIGVLEMARAIRAGVPHRARGDLAYHVLDTMVSIAESIETGEFVKVASTAAPARPLPEDWDPTAATLT